MKKYIIFALAGLMFFGLTHNIKAQEFNDIHSLHINREAVEYLQTNDVIEGYTDGNYKPENRINRAEFTKIIVASQVESPWGSYCFKDVKNEWFAKYICTAKRLGYIKGYPDGTFKPGDYINFAESSQIISKALNVTPDTTGTQGEWFAGYVNGLAQQKAIPSTIQFFDKDVSRGEMAEIVWRVKENRTDKVSQDYESVTQTFPAIKSCAALKEKFDIYQSYQYGYRGDVMFLEGAEGEGEGEGEAVPMAAKSEAAEEFSTTNIQVTGVDEADIIKNDGKYIYMVKGTTVRILEAYPPSGMKEVSNLDFTEKEFRPIEMFVNEDQLIIIGQTWKSYYPVPLDGVEPLIYPSYPYHGSKTKVYILDITDRSNPTEERVVTFDGNYHTSRRIQDNLYLVLNEHPRYWVMEDVEEGEDLLPQFKDGNKDVESMVGCVDIHYFPGRADPRYLIVTSIPLDDPDGEIDREVFLGSSNNVYSSRTHLYVATNEVNYGYYTDWDWGRDRTNMLVFKFALEDGNINYIDRARVPGRILNQFSMDAHIDHFRIATTTGDMWDEVNPSTSNVYVLDKEMKTVGKIEGIAPGEKIYSTRFLGDRLYMVTFKKVDPLFVIDLKEPTNPKILGKLKIPGYSDYLHPFDENHIIGFGKEAIDAEKGNFAWYQGFKMALFDVSDVANPKQKFVELIGDRGTDSELLRNHKALLFDKEKELLAFPIKIVKKVAPEELECGKYRYSDCPNLCYKRCIPSSCTEDASGVATCTDDCDGLGSCTDPSYDRYATTFSGAVVYTLNETDGFNQRGRITHYTEEDILKMGDYWPYNYEKNIQRIIYIGDYLYTISQGKIKASDMDDTDEVNALNLKD